MPPQVVAIAERRAGAAVAPPLHPPGQRHPDRGLEAGVAAVERQRVERAARPLPRRPVLPRGRLDHEPHVGQERAAARQLARPHRRLDPPKLRRRQRPGVGPGDAARPRPQQLEQRHPPLGVGAEGDPRLARRKRQRGDARHRRLARPGTERPVEPEPQRLLGQRRRQRQPPDPRRRDLDAPVRLGEAEVEVGPEARRQQRRADRHRHRQGLAVHRGAPVHPGQQPLGRGEHRVHLGLGGAPAGRDVAAVQQRPQPLGDGARPLRRAASGRPPATRGSSSTASSSPASASVAAAAIVRNAQRARERTACIARHIVVRTPVAQAAGRPAPDTSSARCRRTRSAFHHGSGPVVCRESRRGEHGRNALGGGRRLHRRAAAAARPGPRRRAGGERRGGPAGDRRLAGPCPAAADPRPHRRGAAHSRDRHARRLLDDPPRARPARGRPARNPRGGSEARRGRPRQPRPRRPRRPRRGHRRPGARDAPGPRRPLRLHLHRRRQGVRTRPTSRRPCASPAPAPSSSATTSSATAASPTSPRTARRWPAPAASSSRPAPSRG